MNNNGFEIERKYLIRYPNLTILGRNAEATDIVQTYLLCPEPGSSERVRKRGADGVYVYTHTMKTRVSNMRRVEIENEISEREYNEYLRFADPKRRTIYKTRYCLEYKNQLFEIDVYPFWSDRAVMEIELEDESQRIRFPEMINIIKEITDDGRYTNKALATGAIPNDII